MRYPGLQEIHAVPALHVRGLDLFLQQLEFPYAGHCHLVLVRDQTPIEVYREREEDYQHRYQHYAGRPGGDLRKVIELHPAEYRDLQQEQKEAQQRGEGPRDLDVPV